MTKDQFIYALTACGCLLRDGKTWYEHNELIECLENLGLFEQESVTDFADRCKECGKTIKQKYTDELLDKITAEIEQTASRYSISRERGGMGQVEWSDRLIKESEVLQILDKYDTAKIKNDMADIGKELRTRFDKYKAESEG